ncbi:MAG: phosphate ABC transporter permease PstA [Chloroflexi bacterium]|nr:phosphate ABC transporter permease PstA [Chloroflexota bacterium]
MQRLYFGSLVIAIIVLILLLANVVNQSFGLVAQRFAVDPDTLASNPLDQLSAPELAQVLLENVPRRLLVIARDNLYTGDPANFTSTTFGEIVGSGTVSDELRDVIPKDLAEAQRNVAFAEVLGANLSQEQLFALVDFEIIKTEIDKGWPLHESLLNRAAIEAEVAADYPGAELVFKSWLSPRFVTSPLSSKPVETGIRQAVLGTIWLLGMTVLIAFPLGVGAAIYLEEYASDNWFNRLIETNIRNLAGVPSIIYGMLGLTIFVRTLEGVTGGRSIFAGALTMSLLILPVIIINAREALRAVPSTIREASYGLGATRWQTISRQVFPSALPGMLTGTILGLSRAIGETAPLFGIASTFINTDPTSPFSRFTVLPMQIYSWTGQPSELFRFNASATIILLLVILLTMNSVAIVLRNRAVNQRA